MGYLASLNYSMQSNTLSELQLLNLDGFIQQSPIIDILFVVFIILIIAYLIWTRKK